MATDIFLKIDGIKGESKDKSFKGEIDIDSFSFGVHNESTSGRGGGGGAGKANFQDFAFNKEVDKASPLLMLACASGKHIPKADLIVRKAGGDKQEEYYTVKFTDILISSFDNSGSESDNPMESISFNFAKIEFFYKEQNEQGGLVGTSNAGWNLKENAKV